MVWNVGNAFKVHEFRQLVELSGLKKTHTVLDLGCGTGLQTVLLARRCASILGVDVSPKAIKEAQEGRSAAAWQTVPSFVVRRSSSPN